MDEKPIARQSSGRNFTMPATSNKKVLSKSMTEPMVALDEMATFTGQQFVPGMFRMYDEKAVIQISLNLRTYEISIQQGITSRISRRRFLIQHLEQVVTWNMECQKENYK